MAKIVIDTQTVTTNVELRVVKGETHKRNFTLEGSTLHLGNKEVVDFPDYCESYPLLKQGKFIPALYCVRFRVCEELNTTYAEFITGFDLLDDGRVWCGGIDERRRSDNKGTSPSTVFNNIGDAIKHIDNVVGKGDWNFFMEEIGVGC